MLDFIIIVWYSRAGVCIKGKKKILTILHVFIDLQPRGRYDDIKQ